MRYKFYKKIFVSLLLIVVLGGFSVGCAGVAPPPPGPPVLPTSLTVYSQGFWCYGYVWINGASTGQWLDYNGAVTITGLIAGTVANVQIVDNWGWDSLVKMVVLTSGQNVLTFTFLDCP